MNYHNDETKVLSSDAEEATSAEFMMEENTVLLPLNYSNNWMHINYGSYVVTEKAIVNLDNYEATKPHFPLLWKKGESVYDLMKHYGESEFINVGSGQEVSIRQLTELVKATTGFGGEIVWDTTKPDGTPRKLMDSSRLFTLGWKPEISLENGIQLAYEDFLKKTSK